MFHARSIRRSPAERYFPSNAPMLSGATRSRTNVTPLSIQGFRAASFGSNSMIVMRAGATSRCLSRIGSVQRATAPNPTNTIRCENVGILCRAPLCPALDDLLDFLDQNLGVSSAALVGFSPARRQIVWRALDEASLGLKVGKRLRRERQKLGQTKFTRLVLDKLYQPASDALILVSRAHIQARQLALSPIAVDVQSDACDRILVDF